jgi:hypothetical protein
MPKSTRSDALSLVLVLAESVGMFEHAWIEHLSCGGNIRVSFGITTANLAQGSIYMKYFVVVMRAMDTPQELIVTRKASIPHNRSRDR